MTSFDQTSPGFQITVISASAEPRVGGRADAETAGQILDRLTDVTEFITEFTFEDDEKAHDVLKLKVDNSDLRFFDNPAWVQGNLVRFFFGYAGKVFGPRLHTISKVDGFLTLTITAVEEAGLVNTAKNRIFKNATRAEVVRKIVSENVFRGVRSVDIDLTTLRDEKPRDWQQARQSDWQFLQHLAEDPGFELYIEGDVLHFHPRRLERPPVRRYEYFFGAGDLIDFDIKEWKTNDRPSETTVAGRDPVGRKNFSPTGSDKNTTRPTLGNQNTLSTKRNISGTLETTERRVSGKTVDTTPESAEATAKAQADARFRKQEQGEIKAKAKIIGDPLLFAKQVIEIVGIGQTLSGKYYIEKATHRMSRGIGYVTELELLKNAVAQLPTSDNQTLDPAKAKENSETVSADRRQSVKRDPFTGELSQRPRR